MPHPKCQLFLVAVSSGVRASDSKYSRSPGLILAFSRTNPDPLALTQENPCGRASLGRAAS
jgi:hypothetical protein